MAGGIIGAGMAGKPYGIHDRHSRFGVVGTLLPALVIIWLIADPFRGLLISQAALSVQLPITMIVQTHLTSSRRIMGKYANGPTLKATLIALTAVVTLLNIMLLADLL